MTDLAGSFHFATENKNYFAKYIADELRRLGILSEQIPELQWNVWKEADGVDYVYADVDRIRTIHAAGDGLTDMGIISEYGVIEFRPSEEDELMGQDRRHAIAIPLHKINKTLLKETNDLLASNTVTSLFFKSERNYH